MKIFFITNHLKGTDGWSRYSLDMVKGFSEYPDTEVICIVSELSNNGFTEINILSSPLYYLANPLKCFIDALKLKNLIRKHKPEILHFEVEPYVNILSFLSAKESKKILCIHGTYAFIPNLFKNPIKKFFSNFFFKKSINKLDGVVSVSEFTKEYFERNIKKMPVKNIELRVIRNGINYPSAKRESFFENFNSIKRIIFVGGVKSRKGVLEAIEGINHYKNNYSADFILNIAGKFDDSDPYIKKIKDKISVYGLENHVFLTGHLSDQELNEEYLNADLLIMTSLNNGKEFEGFGLVYLEANAKGVPVIGSKDSGAREAIVHGKTGFLVDPFNKEEIAGRINDVLLKGLIKSEDCVNWAMSNDVSVSIQDTLKFYKDIINKNQV